MHKVDIWQLFSSKQTYRMSAQLLATGRSGGEQPQSSPGPDIVHYLHLDKGSSLSLHLRAEVDTCADSRCRCNMPLCRWSWDASLGVSFSYGHTRICLIGQAKLLCHPLMQAEPLPEGSCVQATAKGAVSPRWLQPGLRYNAPPPTLAALPSEPPWLGTPALCSSSSAPSSPTPHTSLRLQSWCNFPVCYVRPTDCIAGACMHACMYTCQHTLLLGFSRCGQRRSCGHQS